MEHTRCVCLKVLFLVQFEKITTGWQLLDEQHILFKADSVKQAQEQLTFYRIKIAISYGCGGNSIRYLIIMKPTYPDLST